MTEPRRIPLTLLPTPMHRLDRLSDDLGVDLWIKRDDLTGFAMGGNKGRKLEYLMAEAQTQRATTVVSCGSTQSNFIRQLGAACAMLGMRCAAAVCDLPFEPPFEPAGEGLPSQGGNVLLDEMLGVELHWSPNQTWTELYARADALADERQQRGETVYRIPIGGSSGLGAYAFYQAGQEALAQGPEFDAVVTATSSGSTQAGLHRAFSEAGVRLIGIAADPEPDLGEDIAAVSAKLDALWGQSPKFNAHDFEVDVTFAQPAYGVPSATGNAAIELMARAEGIFLDPIYSGKAFAGLLAMVQRGELEGRILFWHTGGTPSLFAHP
ncbi:MAG: 1-aminocyclopropane-1-carboxylate deaminase/D-cysteine desulfhydrase [Fimbriimonadaceae bacterium]